VSLKYCQGQVYSGKGVWSSPDGNGRRRKAEAGQGFSPAGVGTDWIQRQGDRALIPCVGSGQAETEAETDGMGVETKLISD